MTHSPHILPARGGRVSTPRAGSACEAAPPARGSPGRGRPDPSVRAGRGPGRGRWRPAGVVPSRAQRRRGRPTGGGNPIKEPDPASSPLPFLPSSSLLGAGASPAAPRRAGPRPASRPAAVQSGLTAAAGPLARGRQCPPSPLGRRRGNAALMEVPGRCQRRCRCLASLLLLASCVGCAAAPRRSIPRRQGRAGGRAGVRRRPFSAALAPRKVSLSLKVAFAAGRGRRQQRRERAPPAGQRPAAGSRGEIAAVPHEANWYMRSGQTQPAAGASGCPVGRAPLPALPCKLLLCPPARGWERSPGSGK